MSWSVQVRALRLRKGLKQAALADMLGLDQATVSRWERGLCTPTVAVQRQVRAKLDDIDGVGDYVEGLFQSVVGSSLPCVLTAPGSFKTVAASVPALEYFGLGDRYPDYDWAAAAPTPHQTYIYSTLMTERRLFHDRTIYRVDSSVSLRLPSGQVVRNRATYFPVCTNDSDLRLIIHLEGKEPYDGGEGHLTLHRATHGPEHLTIGGWAEAA